MIFARIDVLGVILRFNFIVRVAILGCLSKLLLKTFQNFPVAKLRIADSVILASLGRKPVVNVNRATINVVIEKMFFRKFNGCREVEIATHKRKLKVHVPCKEVSAPSKMTGTFTLKVARLPVFH